MAIKIPADATVARDSRLTLIRIISTLYDRLVESDDGLKSKVKKTLQEKKVDFAESDYVIAALRPGAAKASIDPAKLYDLVKAKKITLEQFLACVVVVKEPLKKYLAGDAIDQITTSSAKPQPSLFTEFKPGVEIDLESLSEMLGGAFLKVVPINPR